MRIQKSVLHYVKHSFSILTMLCRGPRVISLKLCGKKRMRSYEPDAEYDDDAECVDLVTHSLSLLRDTTADCVRSASSATAPACETMSLHRFGPQSLSLTLLLGSFIKRFSLSATLFSGRLARASHARGAWLSDQRSRDPSWNRTLPGRTHQATRARGEPAPAIRYLRILCPGNII